MAIIKVSIWLNVVLLYHVMWIIHFTRINWVTFILRLAKEQQVFQFFFFLLHHKLFKQSFLMHFVLIKRNISASNGCIFTLSSNKKKMLFFSWNSRQVFHFKISTLKLNYDISKYTRTSLFIGNIINIYISNLKITFHLKYKYRIKELSLFFYFVWIKRNSNFPELFFLVSYRNRKLPTIPY